MVTSSSSLSWFGSTTPSNAATLRSQVIKPGTNNAPIMSSNLELGVPTSNSPLMVFVQPNAKPNKATEKPRQAGVGNRLNLIG